jgi:hypothetical protein
MMIKATTAGVSSSTRHRKGRVTASPEPASIHPRSVPTLDPEDEVGVTNDQMFADGARGEVDTELRYRMISERAYHRYVDRGYTDGEDLDDWLQAEADVDHLLLSLTAGPSGA